MSPLFSVKRSLLGQGPDHGQGKWGGICPLNLHRINQANHENVSLLHYARNRLLPHVNSYLKWNFQMFHPNLILSRWQRQAWWFSKQHHCYISWPLQPGRSVGVPCVYASDQSLSGRDDKPRRTMIDRSLYVSTELVTVTRTCTTNFDCSQIGFIHACRAKVF